MRSALGYTQAQLAEQLGLDQSSISRMERGDIPFDERSRLAVEALLMRVRTPDVGNAHAHTTVPSGTDAPADREAA